MRELLVRIVRRAIPVTISLAIIGYLLGELFLILERMYNAHPDPANQAVRWRAPINMAVFGLTLLVIFEVLGYVIKHKKPTQIVERDAEPQKVGAAK